MPFLRDVTYPEGVTLGVEATLGREALAAFRLENLIGSTLSDPNMSIGRRFHEAEPGFDVFEEIRGTDYEDRPELFDDIFNRTAMEARFAQLDREEEDRRVLAAGGWSAVALSMGAGVADPTILIPGAAAVRAGRTAQIGYSVGRSALLGAGVAAGATALQETGLQATQELRTAEETAFAIGGSVILGGLIGAAGARYLTRAEWDQLSDRMAVELAGEVAEPVDVATTVVRRMESAGAARVDEIDISDLDVGGPRIAQALARATSADWINPGLFMNQSPSREARLVFNQLAENSLYTRMNMEGRTLGPSVETLLKEVQRGALADWTTQTRRLFHQHRRAGGSLTERQFMEAISFAGRRGDIDTGGDEFVTRAAQLTRSLIFEPLLQRGQRVGAFPDDIQSTTAISYFTRLWNRNQLLAQEPRFRQIAGDYFRDQLARLPQGEGPDFVSAADLDDYIQEAVSATFNNLVGRGGTDVPTWMVPVKRGPLKERTFQIRDELVEEFLENDAAEVVGEYVRRAAAEIELVEKFGRADMRDQLARIDIEYDELSQAAESAADRRALDVRRRKDRETLEAFRDQLRGTYRNAEYSSSWGALTRSAMTMNYVRLLGGVTTSSLPDAMRPIAVHGLRATMREALPALISRTKAARISRADARRLGPVTDIVLQSRTARVWDVGEVAARASAYDRFLDQVGKRFSLATLLPFWNDGWRTISAVMTQNRMARNVLNWRGISAKERNYMAFIGVSDEMGERIAAMLHRHGVEDNGIWGANVAQWDDRQAARIWAAALNADVDRTIIVPGIADRPLWARSNPGKVVTQFMSFAMASHSRVLISGLQESPRRFAVSLVGATAMGMMVEWLKHVEKGDYEEVNRLLENPGLWIASGLDRSGMLTLPFEVSNTAERLGLAPGITTGIQAAFGDEDRSGVVSRFANRNATGTVLGPTAGMFQDLVTVAGQVRRRDFTVGGVNAAVRLLPGQNLPGVRSGVFGFVRPELQEAVE